MKKLTKWWILSIACLAISGIAIGCGDNENNENKGTGGTGGTAGHAGHGGTGGTGGTAGHGGTGGTGGTAGHGGTGGTGGVVELSTVSGKVVLNPIAAASGVAAPSFSDLHIRIVDAGLALSGDPNALVGEGETDSEGNFELTDVDLSANTVGFVITVSGPGFADSTMGLCIPGETLPQLVCGNRTGVMVFAVPSAFVTELEGKLGDNTLLSNGFVLGGVSTPTMQPISGVSIAGDPNVMYLNTDFTKSDGDVTTDLGAFVVKPTGVETLTPSKNGLEFVPDMQPVGKTANVVFQALFIGTPTP